MPDYLTPATDTDSPPARNSTGRGFLPGPPDSLIRSRQIFTWSEKLALVVLWAYADGDGWAWPTLKALSEEMGCDLKTARASVDSLRDRGFLRIEKWQGPDGAQGSNYLRIYADALAASIKEADAPTENGTGAIPETDLPPYRIRGGPPTESGRPPLPKTVGKGLSGKVYQKDLSEKGDDAPAPARTRDTADRQDAGPGPETGTASPPNPTSKTVPSSPRRSRRRNGEQLLIITEATREQGARVLADIAFMAEVQTDFPGMDLPYQGRKWLNYIETKEPSNYKNSFHNWCEKVIVFAKRDAEKIAPLPHRNGAGPPPARAAPDAPAKQRFPLFIAPVVPKAGGP